MMFCKIFVVLVCTIIVLEQRLWLIQYVFPGNSILQYVLNLVFLSEVQVNINSFGDEVKYFQ